ncbi:MAG: AbiH family protein [Breznakibacter sp.]
MNRLIIIGNGFDLAHGLKTSAKDFIEDYLLKAINKFRSTDIHIDQLLEIKFSNEYYSNSFKQPIGIKDLSNTIKQLNDNERIVFQMHSLLFKNLYNKIFNELKWVDIELDYFDLLATLTTSNPNYIKKYNEEFDEFKTALIDYLFEQQSKKLSNSSPNDLINCFTEDIIANEIVTEEILNDYKPERLYFVNFNYTNTIANYVEFCNSIIPSEVNFIHGSLCKKHGAPIFGFGDEKNEKYLSFEKSHNIELFRHIKSFEYLKNQNFHNLTRYIESNSYQVHIYGHSCGITDRTLLKQIFEHHNCKSIKIFFHKKSHLENDYTEKTYEISRHIEDKILLRKKMVPFTLSREMPQPL